jgi:hypothetical protein
MLASLLASTLVLATPSPPTAAPAPAPAPAAAAEPAAAPEPHDDWADRPLIRRPMPAPAFFLPGLHYASWTPIRDTGSAHGGGLELSIAKWLPRSSFVLGVFGQLERVGRTRAALGFEVGYDVVGLELGVARDFAHGSDSDAQWSLQLATYVSVGALYLSPRWLIPLARGGDRAPGYGAILAVGFKLPIVIAEGRR